MWEALMLLRSIASAAPRLTIGRHRVQPALAPCTPGSAIRLGFAGYRLSLPVHTASLENHDQKIA